MIRMAFRVQNRRDRQPGFLSCIIVDSSVFSIDFSVMSAKPGARTFRDHFFDPTQKDSVMVSFPRYFGWLFLFVLLPSGCFGTSSPPESPPGKLSHTTLPSPVASSTDDRPLTSP